jgi:hypothetical protein
VKYLSVLAFAQQLQQEQQLGLATDIESRILELKRLFNCAAV